MDKLSLIRKLNGSSKGYYKNRAIFRAFLIDTHCFEWRCTASTDPIGQPSKLISTLRFIQPDLAGELYNLILAPRFSNLCLNGFRAFVDNFGDIIIDWD